MALVLLIGLMSILLTSTCGLNLTSLSSEYQAVLGDNISLGCHFTLASVDVGALEIEWTVNRSDGQEEEEHLICYIEDFLHHFTDFEGRVHFSSSRPQDGDTSLTIERVKITDKGTYRCTVQKLLVVQNRKVRESKTALIKLMVMEEVSVPFYGSDGGTESDVDLKLRNRASLVTTFPTNYSLLTSTETSASTQDDLSSQDNAKTTRGTIIGTPCVIFTGSFAVAVSITFIIIILAGLIFHCWKQKRQQKSDEENVSADAVRLVLTQSEMAMVMKEFDVVVITVHVL